MRPLHLGALAALALAACHDAAPAPGEELAAEVRALRLWLQRSERPGASPAAEAPDAQSVLAPLRPVLEQLAATQREQTARQLALAQELQRWSQVVGETASDARAGELEALTGRLRALEQTLAAQDARHREVEALLQRALEHTADRLDVFLQRLDGGGERAATPPAEGTRQGAPPDQPAPRSTAPGGTAPATPAPTPAPANERPAPEPPRETPPGGAGAPPADDARGPPAARASNRWWWLALSGAAACVAVVFLRRARVVRGAPFAVAAREAPPREPPQPDAGAQEIWAAAALLGEAVGRLRQRTSVDPDAAPAPDLASLAALLGLPAGEAASGAGSCTVPAAGPELAVGGVVPEPAANGAAHGVPAAAGARAAPAAAPPVEVVARFAGEAAGVLAALAREPAVLRRPAPSVRAADGVTEARFCVLPALPPGECQRLVLRVRAAAR